MKDLAQFLWLALKRGPAEMLLTLYPNNDAVTILKAEYPDAEIWDQLAAALESGAKPKLPHIDLNKGGNYPPIRGDS